MVTLLRSLRRFLVPGLALAFLAEPVGPVAEASAAPAAARVGESRDAGDCVKRSRGKKKRRTARKRRGRRRRLARWQVQLLRELAEPRFRVDATGARVPDLRSAAGVVYDPAAGKALWSENADVARPIASITKVMTALVFMEGAPDLTRRVTIERSDVTAASKTRLRAGDEVSVEDLLHLLVLSSDNAAARALARSSEGGAAGFVARMNEKARALGLSRARFADPSGLDERNVATAEEVARMLVAAVDVPAIRGLMQTRSRVVDTTRRTFEIHSTNRLLAAPELGVLGGKTGFINEAGYCFAAVAQPAPAERPVAVVVLGARVKGGNFLETRHLVNWARTQLPGLPVAVPGATLLADADLERLAEDDDDDGVDAVPGGGETEDGADDVAEEPAPAAPLTRPGLLPL